jgi:hypothetical protein
VFFDATVAFPTSKDVIHRIELSSKLEVNDMDIIEESEGEFVFAYCTNKDIYSGKISYDFSAHKLKSKVEDSIHQRHLSDALSKQVRTKYRCLRFISPNHVLVLFTSGSTSELLVLKIYPKDGPGDIVLRMVLPRRLAAAVDFDTCILDADQKTGDRQVVIAVAGQRTDLSVFTLDVPGKGSPKSFRTVTHINGLHELPMKKVVLSPFYSPYAKAMGSSEKPLLPQTGHQFLRLASISLSNTIVVDYLPLHPIRTKSSNPRYVLDSSSSLSRIVRSGSNIFVIAFVLLVTLILAQSVLDAKAAEGHVSSIQLIPQQFRTFLYQARQDNDPVKHVIQEVAEGHQHHRLRDILRHHHGHEEGNPEAKTAIVIRLSENGADKIAVEVHEDHKVVVESLESKRWDQLTVEQKEVWKQRLIGTGRWTTGEGETILKSIFFSELAGAVGRAAFGG